MAVRYPGDPPSRMALVKVEKLENFHVSYSLTVADSMIHMKNEAKNTMYKN